MHPGDPLGTPSSFTARRPAASGLLPAFALPHPQLSQKFQPYDTINANQHAQQQSNSLTSVGNLPTPPTNLSGDGLTPNPSAGQNHSAASNQGIPPYTPNGYWQSQAPTPYGYANQHGQAGPFIPYRGMYSPSLNSLSQVRGISTTSSAATDGLPPPPYEINPPPFSSSHSMSAPASVPAPSAHQQVMSHQHMMAHQQQTSSATHPSPVHAQEGFQMHRPPPTPSYYNGSQQSNTSQHATFPYSSGPSPTQASPVSAGGPLQRMSSHESSVSAPSIPSQSPHAFQRPFGSYPLPTMPGPVMSNLHSNPNGQMSLVGVPGGIMPGYNSGHGAQMQHMYGGQHSTQQQPQNDRPFKCDQCPQSFNRNHDLKRHKRIHLAVKPFPCGHCDKSFSRKDALKVRNIDQRYNQSHHS